MTGNRWNEKFLQGSAEDPQSLATKRLARAMTASYPRRKAGPMPEKTQDLEAMADFAAFVESGCCVGHNAFLALTNLVELCAKYGQAADARRYLLLWQERSIQYWNNFSFVCLAANRHTASLLAEGLLAKGYQLDPASSDRYVDGLCTALQQRMATGRTLAFGKLSWQQLLEKFSKNAIAQNRALFSSQTIKAKWLGCAAATATAIEEAEKRAQASLPQDYKTFLLVTNGFQATSPTALPIFEIGEVKWLRDAMPDLLAAWDKPEFQGVHRSLKKSLFIGDLDGEQQLLLVPSEPGNDAGQWECWFFASWIPGEHRHPSFRAYMEATLLEQQSDAGSDEGAYEREANMNPRDGGCS